MDQNTEQGAAPVFSIEKIFVKDMSVEVPNAPAIFFEEGSPEISIQLGNSGHGLGNDLFEVVLTVTVTAKIDEKVVFLVEVGQGGIFRLANIPDEQIEPIIAIACPNLLFPYARQVVSDAVSHAGFPPVVLQPVNFEALYAASLEQRAAQQAGGDNATLQ